MNIIYTDDLWDRLLLAYGNYNILARRDNKGLCYFVIKFLPRKLSSTV